jgi:hypothetical protein
MAIHGSRREFHRRRGAAVRAQPAEPGLRQPAARKQRLVVMFSPNGVVPKHFWPDEEGTEFTLKESLQPLEPFKDRR